MFSAVMEEEHEKKAGNRSVLNQNDTDYLLRPNQINCYVYMRARLFFSPGTKIKTSQVKKHLFNS